VQIVCAVQKAQPAICGGNRNPRGQEPVSEAAERGNCPEAKPNEDRLKGRRACTKNKLSYGSGSKPRWTFGRLTRAYPRLSCPERKEKETAPNPGLPPLLRICNLGQLFFVQTSRGLGGLLKFYQRAA
jgi:hypothetical protein